MRLGRSALCSRVTRRGARAGSLVSASSLATVALACSSLALAVPDVGAAAGWLAPGDLSEKGQDAGEPQVAIDPGGNAIALWERFDGSNGIIQAAVRQPGGAWLPSGDISEKGDTALQPAVAVDSHGNATAVWTRVGVLSGVVVLAAFRPAGGAWQPAVIVSEEGPGQDAREPRVAVDPQGDAIVVWRDETTSELVQAASRPAGGAWQKPLTLSEKSGSAFEPAVALDSEGDTLAVWTGWDGSVGGHYLIRSVIKPAGGVWQPSVSVSEDGQNADAPQLAFDPQGNATAVWERSDGSNEIVQAALRPAGGAWQPPVDVSQKGKTAHKPQLALDAAGDALAVWERFDGNNWIVQSALRPEGDAWQPAANLSEVGQDAERPAIAVDPGGDATAVWQRSDGSNKIVQAAYRKAGDTWQKPVNVSQEGHPAFQPRVAEDAQGDGLAVWSRFDGGNDIVQAAGYDATPPLLSGVSIPSAGTAGQPIAFSVAPLDNWSALGATSWSFGDGAGALGTSVVHTYATAGQYQVTLTSADAAANTASTVSTITIAAAPTIPPTKHPRVPPAVTNATESHATWRAGSKLARISGGHRPPVGTIFSFALDQPATVTFAFSQRLGGRRVGRRCLAPTSSNHSKPACARTITAGTLRLPGHAGANKLAFQGRISATKRLKPGRHTLTITATNTAGQTSAPQKLSFTIAK